MRHREAVFIIALRVAAALAVATFAVVLAARQVVPTGRLTLTTDLVRPWPSVGDPKPNDRFQLPARGSGSRVAITGSPLYVDVSPRGAFDQVTVTARYENEGQPLVAVGALTSAPERRYDVRIVESALLDRIAWPRVSSGTLALYSKDGAAVSVDGFLSASPAPSRVAVSGAVPTLPFTEKLDAPRRRRTVAVSLRGAHRFIVYVDGAPLTMTFSLQDMNRSIGADPVSVTVRQLGDDSLTVASAALDDDGDAKDDQRSVGLRALELKTPVLARGAYAVDVGMGDDVFIRSFDTDAAKLVAAGRVFLGDFIGYSDHVTALTVYASGERLTAQTQHPEGEQALRVGPSTVDLGEVGRPTETALGEGFTAVTSPKRDIILESGGVFAFAPEDEFSPLPLELGWYSDEAALKSRGIDSILSGYATPGRDGQDRVASVTFDLGKLATTETGAYRFAIDIPAISAVPGGLRIGSLSFAFARDPHKGGFASFWKSLFAGEGGMHDAGPPSTKVYDDIVP
jgi:hypothetical protein